ncbi:MAG: hypothetical protein HY587_05310 [Candidatus Omnitrophica bacterium]|nr:hypothetical protein [Candidatus Omnitrophota bacterium]
MNSAEWGKKALNFIRENELGPAFTIAALTLILLGLFFGISDLSARSKTETDILEKIRILQHLGEDIDFSLVGAEILYADELSVIDSFGTR